MVQKVCYFKINFLYFSKRLSASETLIHTITATFLTARLLLRHSVLASPIVKADSDTSTGNQQQLEACTATEKLKHCYPVDGRACPIYQSKFLLFYVRYEFLGTSTAMTSLDLQTAKWSSLEDLTLMRTVFQMPSGNFVSQ